MVDPTPLPATPESPASGVVTKVSTSGWAIVSLILGCTSLVLGIFTGVPAIICSIFARGRIDRSGGVLRGRGLTFAGLLTGCIGILLGIIPHPGGIAQNQARRAQAKTDAWGIAAALNAYQTEYGKYPFDDLDTPAQKADILFGAPGTMSNARLIKILRAIDSDETRKYNPRMIVFFDGKTVSDPAYPRSGFMPDTAGGPQAGAYFDPWGNEYRIAIDTNYDNLISNLPYTDLQGANAPHVGVAVFSLGKDGKLGTHGDNTYGAENKHSDDILSWK